MKERPKISIIVPVHNAGKQLEACLNSLTGQTLKEIEIILVVDCPTDGSDHVAAQFAAKDSRIRLIRNPANLHVGLSRNTGIEQASGEYLGFCDHDDYCEPMMYEILYRKASEGKLDIVRCNYTYSSKDKHLIYDYPFYPPSSFRENTLGGLIRERISGVVWNYLFRTDFIREHHIRFIDTRTSKSEDTMFLVRTFFRTTRIGAIPDSLYLHYWYPASTGANQGYHSLRSTVVYYETLHSFLEKENRFEQYEPLYLEGFSRSMYRSFRRSLVQLPLKQVVRECREVKKNQRMKDNIRRALRAKNLPGLLKAKPTAAVFMWVLRLI